LAGRIAPKQRRQSRSRVIAEIRIGHEIRKNIIHLLLGGDFTILKNDGVNGFRMTSHIPNGKIIQMSEITNH